MLPFLLFITLAVAEQYYIGPTEDGSIANSAFVMLINDEADSATTSIGTCFQDKSYYFNIMATEGQSASTAKNQRTFLMRYYTSTGCELAYNDRNLTMKYYGAPTDSGMDEATMKTSYNLWIPYVSSTNTVTQYIKTGCVNALGFYFRYFSTGMHHHLYPRNTQCKGSDIIVKYITNTETSGHATYNIKEGTPEGIDTTAQYGEGDPGFFYYLDLNSDALKKTAADSVNKIYSYIDGSLRTYVKGTSNGYTVFAYTQDVMKNPNITNKLTTAKLCPSANDCSSTTTGTEYIMTSECVRGKIFVQTCDDILRIQKKGVTKHCAYAITEDEETSILAYTTSEHVMFFNNSYFYVNVPTKPCPVKSCHGDDTHATEYYYRYPTVTTDNGDINLKYIKYQFIRFNTKKYAVELTYTANTYKEINTKVNMRIKGIHSDECWTDVAKEIHFYAYATQNDATNCKGYKSGRADFFPVSQCVNGNFFYIVSPTQIDARECHDGQSHWDINTFEGYGNDLLKENIQNGPITHENVNYHVYYSVQTDTFDSTGTTYTPSATSSCPIGTLSDLGTYDKNTDENAPAIDIPTEEEEEEENRPVKPTGSEGNNDKPVESEGGNDKPSTSEGDGNNDKPSTSEGGNGNNDKPSTSEGGNGGNDKPSTSEGDGNNDKPSTSEGENDKPAESEGGNNKPVEPESDNGTEGDDGKPAESQGGNNNNNNNNNNNGGNGGNNNPADGAQTLFTCMILLIVLLF